MNNRVMVIARYTLLEALRARLPLLLLAALALSAAGALFVSELAVIESARARLALYAAAARLAAVFIIATHVLASITREFDDKGMDVFLALDLPRAHYILGKLAGFVLIAVLIAGVVALPLWGLAAPVAVLQWVVAFALELALVAAFSLFCATALGQFNPAAALTAAFYVLARSLTALQLMSAHPLSGAGSMSQEAGRWMLEALALVMPALDRWPQTAWLLDAHAAWPAFGAWLAQGAVYLALIGAAAVVDFQRRNF